MPGRWDERRMLALAEAVGYSETVFVTDGPPEPGRRRYAVRYFSPLAEVPFCGHATIALGAALGGALGAGELELDTPAGRVSLTAGQHSAGHWWAPLASVPGRQQQVHRRCCSVRWTASAGPATSWSRGCRRCSATPAPGTWRSPSPGGAHWRR